jgi:predicted nucleotidyltransferase
MDAQPKDAAVAQALGEYCRGRAASGIVSAYLFGSYASGRSHRESDIDVGGLLRRELFPLARDRFGERVRLAADLVAALKRCRRIDPECRPAALRLSHCHGG